MWNSFSRFWISRNTQISKSVEADRNKIETLILLSQLLHGGREFSYCEKGYFLHQTIGPFYVNQQ
jgi:hypothetical protein